MNNQERARMQVADECAETREEDLGFQMVEHYNYLSSLNHEWSNLCELAVKMYLPNKKYIDELEAKNKQLEKQLKEVEAKLVDAEFILRCIHNESRLMSDYFLKYYGDE